MSTLSSGNASGDLWRIAVRCSAEAEEPVAALLSTHLSSSSTVWVDEETGERTITVYLPLKQRPGNERWRELRRVLGQLHQSGLAVELRSLRLTLLRRKDWAEAWRRHFRPLAIGTSVLIKPSWSRQRPRAGQAVVTLDPGLAFGTGQHPTTGFCLQQIARERPKTPRHPKPHGPPRELEEARSLLDLGTGSGILAIAAAKLGYRPVLAIDNDPASIKVARNNARANQVEGAIQFHVADVGKIPGRRGYDLVCANLMADLLIAERRRIVAQVKPGGTLVLAGILVAQFPGVRRAYEADGLILLRQRREKDWLSSMWGR